MHIYTGRFLSASKRLLLVHAVSDSSTYLFASCCFVYLYRLAKSTLCVTEVYTAVMNSTAVQPKSRISGAGLVLNCGSLPKPSPLALSSPSKMQDYAVTVCSPTGSSNWERSYSRAVDGQQVSKPAIHSMLKILGRADNSVSRLAKVFGQTVFRRERSSKNYTGINAATTENEEVDIICPLLSLHLESDAKPLNDKSSPPPAIKRSSVRRVLSKLSGHDSRINKKIRASSPSKGSPRDGKIKLTQGDILKWACECHQVAERLRLEDAHRRC
jgi:hypothetical protein